MFWRVGSTPLYVLGSIHVQREMPQLSPAESAALAAAEVVVLESNFELQVAVRRTHYTGSRRLRDDIPQPLMEASERLWVELKLGSVAELLLTRPWRAAFAIMMPQLARQGLDVRHSVDGFVLREAKVARKQLFFLETLEQANAPFAEAPLEEQTESLSAAVLRADEGIADVESMATAWVTRRLDAVDPIREKYLQRMPNAYGAALGGRNRMWLPKLLKLARSGRPGFAAVGAMHMIGADSLIELSKAQGLEWIRING